MKITSRRHTKVWITRDLQNILLENTPELERNLESQIKEMDLEDYPLFSQTSVRFRSWDLLRFRYAPRSATGISPMSKLHNLDMQVQGCHNATQRVHKKCQVACTGIRKWNHAYLNMYEHVHVVHTQKESCLSKHVWTCTCRAYTNGIMLI